MLTHEPETQGLLNATVQKPSQDILALGAQGVCVCVCQMDKTLLRREQAVGNVAGVLLCWLINVVNGAVKDHDNFSVPDKS